MCPWRLEHQEIFGAPLSDAEREEFEREAAAWAAEMGFTAKGSSRPAHPGGSLGLPRPVELTPAHAPVPRRPPPPVLGDFNEPDATRPKAPPEAPPKGSPAKGASASAGGKAAQRPPEAPGAEAEAGSSSGDEEEDDPGVDLFGDGKRQL